MSWLALSQAILAYSLYAVKQKAKQCGFRRTEDLGDFGDGGDPGDLGDLPAVPKGPKVLKVSDVPNVAP